jgi:hypothetical protein
VGQTEDFNVRTDAHLSDSDTDFDRVFVDSNYWSFRILAEDIVDPYRLDTLESHYIAAFDSIVNGLNVKKGNGLNVNGIYALKEDRIGYLRSELLLGSNESSITRVNTLSPLDFKAMYHLLLALPVFPVCLNFKNGKKVLFGFINDHWECLIRPIDIVNLMRSENPDLVVAQFPSYVVERVMNNIVPQDINDFVNGLDSENDSLSFDYFSAFINTDKSSKVVTDVDKHLDIYEVLCRISFLPKYVDIHPVDVDNWTSYDMKLKVGLDNDQFESFRLMGNELRILNIKDFHDELVEWKNFGFINIRGIMDVLNRNRIECSYENKSFRGRTHKLLSITNFNDICPDF